MEEEIPPVPLGEELEPDDVLVQLWPFFLDAKDMPERELSPAERIAAMNQSEQEAMTDFLNQLAADPTPYSWYLNEVYYLWDLFPAEMEGLFYRLKWQEGTAADTPALRGEFGDLLGQLTPSPIAVHMPEQGSAITSQGAGGTHRAGGLARFFRADRSPIYSGPGGPLPVGLVSRHLWPGGGNPGILPPVPRRPGDLSAVSGVGEAAGLGARLLQLRRV